MLSLCCLVCTTTNHSFQPKRADCHICWLLEENLRTTFVRHAKGHNYACKPTLPKLVILPWSQRTFSLRRELIIAGHTLTILCGQTLMLLPHLAMLVLSFRDTDIYTTIMLPFARLLFQWPILCLGTSWSLNWAILEGRIHTATSYTLPTFQTKRALHRFKPNKSATASQQACATEWMTQSDSWLNNSAKHACNWFNNRPQQAVQWEEWK